jgi:polysaccharide pyruvyl transferase WcaK-like protein
MSSEVASQAYQHRDNSIEGGGMSQSRWSRSMSAPQIVLFGLFGIGNLGNDGTLEAVLYHIRKYQPSAKITCVCGNPDLVRERYEIETLPFDIDFIAHGPEPTNRVLRITSWATKRGVAEANFWLRHTRWLRQIDQLIVVGTGLLDDFGVRPWGMPYDLFKWCTAARCAGSRVVFLSVGSGRSENRLSRAFALAALRQATYRSYRDVVSAEYLRSVGFDTRSDPIFPDLVFSVPQGNADAFPAAATPPRTIGLGVMGYDGWGNNPASGEAIYRAYLAKLKRFLYWLLEQGFAVRLLTGEVYTDQPPVEELLAFVRAEGQADWQAHVSAEPITDVDDLLRQIATTDLVVASRFHNVQGALMLGRPVVSIGYSKKNDALMAEMGLQAYCQHAEHFTVDELIQRFQSLISEFSQATARIQNKSSEYRAMLDEQYRTIFCGETAKASGV